MGAGLLITFFILLFLVIIFVWLLIRSIRVRSKIGIVVYGIILVALLSIFFINNIDEVLYSKSDARKDLLLANLVLNDDFEIIKNEVVGMPERFQKTILKISEHDKIRIINEIKNGKSFKKLKESRALYSQMWNEKSPRNKVVFTNYFYNNQYIRESYYREKEYVPIHMEISLAEKSNLVELNRIED
jgi:hypothetical protein